MWKVNYVFETNEKTKRKIYNLKWMNYNVDILLLKLQTTNYNCWNTKCIGFNFFYTSFRVTIHSPFPFFFGFSKLKFKVRQ